jgi:hypothetical protein
MRTIPKIFSQRDSQWASQRLGTVNGTTIGSDGCYVTSFATVASYYGKDITPAKLDDWFTNGHVYYNTAGNHNDPANLCSDDMLQVVFGDILYQKTYNYANSPADLNLLKSLLADPSLSVILEVDFNHSPNDGIQTHFLVAVDCDGTSVKVADPWSLPGGQVEDFSKNYGSNPAQTILKYVVYKGNPPKVSVDGNYFVDGDLKLDFTNRDSMKVAFDVWVKVQRGTLVDKSLLQAALDKVKQLEGHKCPSYGNEKETIRTILSKARADIDNELVKIG